MKRFTTSRVIVAIAAIFFLPLIYDVGALYFYQTGGTFEIWEWSVIVVLATFALVAGILRMKVGSLIGATLALVFAFWRMDPIKLWFGYRYEYFHLTNDWPLFGRYTSLYMGLAGATAIIVVCVYHLLSRRKFLRNTTVSIVAN